MAIRAALVIVFLAACSSDVGPPDAGAAAWDATAPGCQDGAYVCPDMTGSLAPQTCCGIESRCCYVAFEKSECRPNTQPCPFQCPTRPTGNPTFCEVGQFCSPDNGGLVNACVTACEPSRRCGSISCCRAGYDCTDAGVCTAPPPDGGVNGGQDSGVDAGADAS